MRWLTLSPVLVTAALLVSCSATTTNAPSQSGTPEPPLAAENEATPPGKEVTLQVGHCFVEPIEVAGQKWVTMRPYVGYGGGLPKGFTEDGIFRVESGSSALFIAEGGAEIGFKVAPHPLPVRGCR